jgi:membrane peptidoglycan carboxypeptidase
VDGRNPRHGERADFNPNVYGKVDPDFRKNRAVEEIYEPGSTFKTVTASAALDEGVLTPETLIDCAPGYIDIGPRRVHDVHPNGTLDLHRRDREVEQRRRDPHRIQGRPGTPGALRAPLRVRHAHAAGAACRIAGIVWSKLSDNALASVSMGYQVGVTPLQMATAVSSIANGGMLMRPHLVRAVIRDGVRHPVAPEALRRTIKADTAAELTTIMEGVVERGTGKPARIDGYTIAGKTGTAAKLINGEYSKQKYFSSFIGFMPSRKPAIAVIVMVDAPSAGPYFGGLVAAPIFKRIGEIAVRHLAIPRSIDPETPVVMPRNIPPSQARPVTFVSSPLGGNGGQDGVMPDLRGLSARAAVRTLARLGLVPRMKGSGFIAEQQPAAGAPIDTTSPVALRLERQLPPPPAETDPARP